jgi:cation:H+ antiporter
MLSYFFIGFGIVLLYFGGEFLVAHASKLARHWGISPMVVGLTIVAFATSSPELAATIAASFKGTSDVALGNVIGSNIANIGLILGVSALIYPIMTSIKFIVREGVFMIAVSGIMAVLSLNGILNRIEGLGFIVLISAYLVVVIKTCRNEDIPENMTSDVQEQPDGSVLYSVCMVILGIVLLVIGADRLVEGAVTIARTFGIPERVIGLTMVALGTSLPELASCVVAAYKKETDIILGNVIGSNIFNVLCVLGTAVLIRPLEFNADGIHIDLLVMMFFSMLILPFLITGLQLSRREGVILIAGYAGYMVFLFQ